MPTSPMSEVIQYLRSTLLPEGPDLTDGQLLECFVCRREPAALEALVQRHGPMVWGVCRRLLGNHHDAEDAFQATFLVLVRRAASIRSPTKIGNWLYGVANQTALKARATRAKRKERERPVTEMPEPAVMDQDLWNDLQPLLDQELSLLPEKYRTMIVLCELEGKTGREVARQLGLPQGTVASRLARARTMLAKRLARHGLAVSGGTLAGVLSQKAAVASVPALVMSSTIKAVTLVAAGQAAAGVISVKVVVLMEGVMKAMLMKKLKTVGAVLLVMAMGLIGARLLSYGAVEEKQNEVREVQEVLVRHPKGSESVPMEQFTGRLGGRQDDSIAVTFAVDERSYLRYQRLLRQHQVKGPGSPLYVGLSDENGFPHQGKLKGFDDRIDPETGTVQAHAILPNPDRLLLPGMFVRVRIPFGPPQKVLEIPDEAVLSDKGKHYLLVVTDKDIVERRAVSLGAADGDMRIIEKGVSPDDWIVVGLVGGLNNLMPGTHVKRRIIGDGPKEEKRGVGKDKPQQQDERGKAGAEENRKDNAAPAEGAGNRVAKKLWAGMSVNQPLFRVGQNTNLLQFNFALINESDKVIDPEIPGYPRLIVNGKELDLSSIPGVGPRDERFKALLAGDNLQFGMGAGQFFDRPGVYSVYWQGVGFRSNEVVFRVMK
jgi:RNA polymerase sigma factor (sigma-70 family)